MAETEKGTRVLIEVTSVEDARNEWIVYGYRIGKSTLKKGARTTSFPNRYFVSK